MEEELSLDNILGAEEIENLFIEDESTQESPPVEDKDNLLGVVGSSNLEPLCRYFKVKKEHDIELVMPLIKESFNKTKYPAFDIKNGLNQFYSGKDAK